MNIEEKWNKAVEKIREEAKQFLSENPTTNFGMPLKESSYSKRLNSEEIFLGKPNLQKEYIDYVYSTEDEAQELSEEDKKEIENYFNKKGGEGEDLKKDLKKLENLTEEDREKIYNICKKSWLVPNIEDLDKEEKEYLINILSENKDKITEKELVTIEGYLFEFNLENDNFYEKVEIDESTLPSPNFKTTFPFLDVYLLENNLYLIIDTVWDSDLSDYPNDLKEAILDNILKL